MSTTNSQEITAPFSDVHAAEKASPRTRLGLVVAHTPDAARIGERLRPGREPCAINRLEVTLDGGRLDDPKMSRRHAEVRLLPGKHLEVRDIGSRHGTFVNAQRVDERWRRLAEGHVVRVGGTLFVARGLASKPAADAAMPKLVGISDGIARVRAEVARYGPTAASVLILGEIGAGKEVVAAELGARSERADPFVGVSIAETPETLVEATLFGHVRGAFSGAVRDRAGVFRTAHRGTLFLDEIGLLDPTVQGKLLRALQEGEILPVGADTPVPVDVRVLSATNADLLVAVREGAFRGDLYSRLAHVTIRVPPLRDRVEDIPVLAAHFTRGLDREPDISVSALQRLMLYRWPFNVRELKSAVEQMVHTTDRWERLTVPRELEQELQRRERELAETSRSGPITVAAIEDALARTLGNVTAAARALGCDRTHLHRLMRDHDVDAAVYRGDG